MRIIGGEKRGFKISGPPEVKISGLKPMPDKVRESIFNILGQTLQGKDVLDLYAGTGAVGLEALSRGAKSAAFVEISKRTEILIKENLNKLGFKAKVFRKDAGRFLKETREKYDLIFITPPHEEIDFKTVELAGKKIRGNGIVVLESSSKTNISSFEGLRVIDQRTYGRLKITFLEKDLK